MRLFRLSVWLAVFALGLCGGLRAQIRVVGSDLLGPRFTAALEEFARENNLSISLELRGTRPGLELLESARADLGLLVVPPGETPPAGEFVSRAIACQPLVVVVPMRSPVTQLTHEQVRGIFAQGGVPAATWGDLGLVGEWRGRALVAHALQPESALVLAFARRTVLNGVELKPTVVLARDPEQLAQRVQSGESAVGLTNALPAEGSGLRAVALAPSVSDPAFTPTPEFLASGDYTLRLPLYVTLRRSSAQRLLPLLRFLLSDTAAETLAPAQFVGLPVGARNQLVFELEELR